ncbi:portal vertex protein [Stenotrophomonas phage RAS14]
MSKTTSFYKIIDPQSRTVDALDSQDITGTGGVYGATTWYYRLVQGSPSRLTRYREYDLMDGDVHVTMALDTIAEEMCGNRGKSQDIFELNLTPVGSNLIPPNVVTTLKAAIKTWTKLNRWDSRIFDICRTTIKYGDSFFQRPKQKNGQYIWIHPKSVVSAIVSQDDITSIKGWHIKEDSKFANPGIGSNLGYNNSANVGDNYVSIVDKQDILRFSLNGEMSDEAPFGMSVLRAAYRSFKQKELLEDALIIYRVQRAPERRVFYINTGKMPPQKVAHHLEQLKNEFRQKKVPSRQKDGGAVDSVYNPASMNEDFFFSENSEGKGSRVEVLPGGQNLGELQDLDYFFNKMWMGLRIPQSYLNGGGEGNGMSNDGRVGIAYLQEIKFSLYVERLQGHIERVMDTEFKRWLQENQIKVDPTLYNLTLPAPSNFAQWRQQQMDSELLGTMAMATDTDFISKRFALIKFGQWTQEDVLTNERMLREEKGLDPSKGTMRDLPVLYFPQEAEAGGFDGGMGGGGGTAFGGGGGMPPDGMDPDNPEGGQGGEGGQDNLVVDNIGSPENATEKANPKQQSGQNYTKPS